MCEAYVRYHWRGHNSLDVVVEILENIQMTLLGSIVARRLPQLENKETKAHVIYRLQYNLKVKPTQWPAATIQLQSVGWFYYTNVDHAIYTIALSVSLV